MGSWNWCSRGRNAGLEFFFSGKTEWRKWSGDWILLKKFFGQVQILIMRNLSLHSVIRLRLGKQTIINTVYILLYCLPVVHSTIESLSINSLYTALLNAYRLSQYQAHHHRHHHHHVRRSTPNSHSLGVKLPEFPNADQSQKTGIFRLSGGKRISTISQPFNAHTVAIWVQL